MAGVREATLSVVVVVVVVAVVFFFYLPFPLPPPALLYVCTLNVSTIQSINFTYPHVCFNMLLFNKKYLKIIFFLK
jgi:hypothetical protein